MAQGPSQVSAMRNRALPLQRVQLRAGPRTKPTSLSSAALLLSYQPSASQSTQGICPLCLPLQMCRIYNRTEEKVGGAEKERRKPCLRVTTAECSPAPCEGTRPELEPAAGPQLMVPSALQHKQNQLLDEMLAAFLYTCIASKNQKQNKTNQAKGSTMQAAEQHCSDPIHVLFPLTGSQDVAFAF